ncbi:MAG: Regulator of chromosome condensation repeat protein [Deltaproteobacteria bacterium]|nr:Regulator of chromosome condensation repeat protein [Deltaproteobacteria bacterium]
MSKRPSEKERYGITQGADLPIPVDKAELISREPRNWVLTSMVIAVALGMTVLLSKYALDVLFIVCVLSVFGFLIHRLIQWLSETELLTPGWTIPILLILGVLGWLTWPVISGMSPMSAFEQSLHFERYLPAPVVRFLEWSEQRGWAQRLLVSAAPSQVGGSTDTGRPRLLLTISSTQTSVRVGQPVTIIARLEFSSPPAPSVAKTVQFLDGITRIAVVPFGLSGQTAIASYTTTGLLVGAHSITARYEPALLFGGVTSSPLNITVTR